MTEISSLITLLRQSVTIECLCPPWDVYLFGSSLSGLRVGSDVDLVLVYKCGDEAMARRFRVIATRRAWDILNLQLDVTLLSENEEESVSFVSREGAARILGSSE
ncbi:nucleotidyltransferase domain-containing protein [Streptomyces antioxidans]|uniref:nucleotidyltransferase domain-containing protein n=1 Tax=Streptomyces antioxidans TaxID=1507734 RepID=UPI000D1AF312